MRRGTGRAGNDLPRRAQGLRARPGRCFREAGARHAARPRGEAVRPGGRRRGVPPGRLRVPGDPVRLPAARALSRAPVVDLLRRAAALPGHARHPRGAARGGGGRSDVLQPPDPRAAAGQSAPAAAGAAAGPRAPGAAGRGIRGAHEDGPRGARRRGDAARREGGRGTGPRVRHAESARGAGPAAATPAAGSARDAGRNPVEVGARRARPSPAGQRRAVQRRGLPAPRFQPRRPAGGVVAVRFAVHGCVHQAGRRGNGLRGRRPAAGGALRRRARLAVVPDPRRRSGRAPGAAARRDQDAGRPHRARAGTARPVALRARPERFYAAAGYRHPGADMGTYRENPGRNYHPASACRPGIQPVRASAGDVRGSAAAVPAGGTRRGVRAAGGRPRREPAGGARLPAPAPTPGRQFHGSGPFQGRGDLRPGELGIENGRRAGAPRGLRLPGLHGPGDRGPGGTAAGRPRRAGHARPARLAPGRTAPGPRGAPGVIRLHPAGDPVQGECLRRGLPVRPVPRDAGPDLVPRPARGKDARRVREDR